MPRIPALPSLATADNSDEIVIQDISAAVTKKITRGDLLKAPLPTDSITTAAIADGAVTPVKVSGGILKDIGWNEAADGGLLTTSYVSKTSVAGASTGKTVRVRYSGWYYNDNSGANRSYTVRLSMDGTLVKATGGVTVALISGTANGMFFSYIFSHTPAAGNHTWSVDALASAGSAVRSANHSVEVTEVM